MINPNLVRLVALLIFCSLQQKTVFASPAACSHGHALANTLELSRCIEENGVTLATYSTLNLLSPYATEFDRRTIGIANGTSEQLVVAVAGVSEINGKYFFKGGQLVEPPSVDQIQRRSLSGPPIKHLRWTVLTQKIQYGAQGGKVGFAVDCATAWQSNREGAMAVSECFPLEERQRFFKMLDRLR